MASHRLCPSCGSKNVSRSARRNLVEKAISLFRVLPYRCQDCRRRFFGGRAWA
jgi:uncharacterized protein with PIN domain